MPDATITRTTSGSCESSESCEYLANFLRQHPKLLVLTGAGISTASGIPDYRDDNGEWKQASPIQYQDFVRHHAYRQRYWARSSVGWPRFKAAQPSRTHLALAKLQQRGFISTLITQNVDGLHQRAGSPAVTDLHGNLAQAVCLQCAQPRARDSIQHWLLEHNPRLKTTQAQPLADGDAKLEDVDFSRIKIPDCESCGGILKPDVVFFGENVPAERVRQCFAAVDDCDAMLVIGSSLMVYSGFRFVKRAHELNKPVVAINRGVTRADHLLSGKITEDCDEVMDQLSVQLG